MNDLIEIFGEPIHTYSRAQALEDGILVDVTETAREAGIRYPVALTAAAYEDCVAWTDADNARKGAYQDQAGRLWDVIWMARDAVRRSGGSDTVVYQVLRVPRTGRGRLPKLVRLTAKCGPGDDLEPVITIDLAC